MYDVPVHIHKAVLMQRLLDGVTHGYVWYTAGAVPLSRAGRLAAKFAAHYGVDWNANRRAYAKRRGMANARFYLLAQDGSSSLLWWLLATGGSGAIHDQERLYLVSDRRRRLRIEPDYELVRRTRPRHAGGGEVWTWRMTPECYQAWRERIIQACRSKSPAAIRQALHSLYRVPGFSGIRHQAGNLVALARREWRRRHGDTDLPGLRAKLPYLERIPDTTVRLSDLRGGVT